MCKINLKEKTFTFSAIWQPGCINYELSQTIITFGNIIKSNQYKQSNWENSKIMILGILIYCISNDFLIAYLKTQGIFT